MKKIFFCLMVLLLTVSCSSDILVDENIVENNTEMNKSNTRTSMEKEYGKIRIKMYEDVLGYDVKISNVKFYNIYNEITPNFGTNFESRVISSDINKPTYDTANGIFSNIAIGTKVQIIISFDAEITANNGAEGVVNLQGVQIVANQEIIDVEANKEYDLLVKLDATSLHLEEITFDAVVEPSVEDIETGGAII